jgi:type II secretory pathway pseudopilin PulG
VKKTHLIAVLFVVAVLATIVITTFSGNRVRCEVCMEFRGMRDCRTAQAANRTEALRTAISNACAQLASGVTDTVQCENTQPASVVWK